MRISLLRTLAFLFAAVAFFQPVDAAQPFEALMQKVPEGANLLVVINVDQILQSDFAKAHDSKQKLADAFAQRLILIPPDATQFVMAAQFDVEHGRPAWEAAVMELKTPLNFERMAAATRKSVETLAGVEAIGGSKVCALNLGNKQLGLLVPSNRQMAARWAKQLKQDTHPFSNYLAETGSYGDTAGTDIILAVDLADLIPKKFIADQLRKNEVLKDRKVDIDQLASILARVRGARLGIKIGTKCNGMLVVDLQDDPAPMADFAKPLLLSILKNAGIMIEELENWTPAVGKNTISLKGILSDEGLRRVMGVVELPPDSVAMMNSAGGAAAGGKAAAENEESLKREASRKYFQSVQQRLDSLRMQKNDAKTNGQMAMWIDMAARGIDRMSMVNVDSDLLDYGANVSTELRQIVAALQGIGIQSGARAAQIYNSGSYYYDDGGSDTNAARRAVRAEEKAAGATSSLDLVRSISNQTTEIRRKMTERYKTDF